MNDTYCMCVVRKYFNREITTSIMPTVFEFILSSIISICGIFLNYKFLKKLKTERRNKPIGRKGNVIEPIMRWFIVLQMAYWPYELFMFSQAVGIANLSSVIPSLCPFYVWSVILGRAIVAYNSLFVALIRYVYIVYERKANQWDFESIGRRFQIASILIPIINVIMLGLTMRPRYFLPDADTNICSHMTPPLITFTMTFVSEPVSDTIAIGSAILVTVVYLNLVEGYLYVKMFQSIKR